MALGDSAQGIEQLDDIIATEAIEDFEPLLVATHQPGTETIVFLMADAVTAALPAQSTPQGYYNIERMVKSVINKGGQVRLCGTCCEARGIKAMPLLNGAEISTMSQLAQWTVESEKVLVF